MKTYNVTAERSGKWWVLQAAEAPGAIGQVRKLSEANVFIEAISFVTGTPEEDIAIKLDVKIKDKRDSRVAEFLEISEKIRELESQQAALLNEIAAELMNEEHMSYRDIGSVLQLSHQRIGQLVKEGRIAAKAAS